MPHRSRLTAALFDVDAADYDAEVAFWSAALGRPALTEQNEPDYVEFEGLSPGRIQFMAQRMVESGHDHARVHLDIETDDVDAEVARLTALGAIEVERVKTWVVLRDPAGLKFCVVRVQSREEFEAHAVGWD